MRNSDPNGAFPITMSALLVKTDRNGARALVRRPAPEGVITPPNAFKERLALVEDSRTEMPSRPRKSRRAVWEEARRDPLIRSRQAEDIRLTADALNHSAKRGA